MFRFTIRDVLWAMVVVAVGLGWWMDHKQIGGLRGQLAASKESFEAFKELRNLEIDDYEKALSAAEKKAPSADPE